MTIFTDSIVMLQTLLGKKNKKKKWKCDSSSVKISLCIN